MQVTVLSIANAGGRLIAVKSLTKTTLASMTTPLMPSSSRSTSLDFASQSFWIPTVSSSSAIHGSKPRKN
ncbi:hypothetical protein Poly59_55410 [Rubripirellula reticaptiva]|uniref:Uncharacterized protein n=1 Tax=Rubripirellula reticaptiva TaxID=2528013 RepID=A0A5C6ECF3_9BACT|nr:hypothetical protein Poly59_55410 [Rubripirellula reticaptiva]